jgi:hypothetical protein
MLDRSRRAYLHGRGKPARRHGAGHVANRSAGRGSSGACGRFERHEPFRLDWQGKASSRGTAGFSREEAAPVRENGAPCRRKATPVGRKATPCGRKATPCLLEAPSRR